MKSQTVRVAFRKWPDGDIIAIFPDEPANHKGDITCYMHVGQHGATDQQTMDELPAATETERAELETEIRRIYKEAEFYGDPPAQFEFIDDTTTT